MIAPVLVLGLFSAIDFGMAAMERSRLDLILRSAAQHAMDDPGVNSVQKVMLASAAASTARGQPNFATPVRFCACPTATSVPVACTSTCGGASYTYIYYRLNASQAYTGIFWPKPINISTQVVVQIR